MKTFVDTKNFNGAILVAQKGKILYNKAFGMANQDFGILNKPGTKFHIASVSKNFTAAAILLLEQRNLLKVTDTISKYVPGLPYGDKITIHQLLTHTSGIPNINNMPEYDTIALFPQTPGSLINVFKNKPLDFTPGAKYSYSNSNYNVLACIIEKVSQINYGDFLAENIFNPLAMQNTAHRKKAAMTITNNSTGYQADR
ncbi:MAG: beta-lactamase family protein, partial [Bacteroidota bacterium]|nr:beta-lactamase family protein [Bacteroidota bacterium]